MYSICKYNLEMFFIQIVLIGLIAVYVDSKRGDLELEDAIRNDCNNTRDCKVHLRAENYTLTRRLYLDHKTFDRLALIGVGYSTRVNCESYSNEQTNNRAMISISGLEEVYLSHLHFHNCHPSKIIPNKSHVQCPKKLQPGPGCSTRLYTNSEEIYKNQFKGEEEKKFEFKYQSIGESPKRNKTNIDYEVNATIGIRTCNQVHIEYISFNNFSYNAIHITDSQNTNLSHLFLYSRSSHVATGYHARGLLYEITNTTQYNNTFRLDINHSFFENIATMSPDIKFNLSSNRTIGDVEVEYGGAGIKLLILSAVKVNININRCYFKGCVAVQGSGLLLLTSEKVLNYSLDIHNSKFEQNRAFVQKWLNPSGGAIMVEQRSDSGITRIRNTVFDRNCANKGGAIGMSIQGKNSEYAVFYSQDNVFSCNMANLGGAVDIVDNFQRVNEFIFKDTIFINNTALTGGAILGFNTKVKVVSSRLLLNKANLGGAVALVSSLLIFEHNVSLLNNSAELKGGAIYSTAYSKIHLKKHAYVLVRGNQANYKGGGIFVFNYYDEYRYRNWSHHIDQLEHLFCFITLAENRGNLMLDFQENHVSPQPHLKNTKSPCMGPDLFANTWGACWDKKSRMFSLMHMSSINLGANNELTGCSVALDIHRYEKLNFVNESFCYFNSSDNTHQPHCHDNLIDIDSFPKYKAKMQEEARKVIKGLRGQYRVPERVYVIYPGFETSVTIASVDSLNQTILTDTVIEFNQEGQDTEHIVKFRYGEFLTDTVVATSSSKVYFSLTTNTADWIHGRLCLKSKLSIRIINYCVPIILAGCMPGFELVDYRCEFKGGRYIRTFDGTNVTTNRNVMMVVNEDSADAFDYLHCTWFQCKCDTTSTVDNCTFNVLRPQDQCKDWLKGKYCTESRVPNQTIAPIYSFYHLFTDRYSFPCNERWLLLVLYFVICAVIVTIIIFARIDIFADYTRSITFYSGILLLMTLSCGDSGTEFVQKLITIPIIVFNLKVTHMYTFCIFQSNGVNQTIFELFAPLSLVFYTVLMLLCMWYFRDSMIVKNYKISYKLFLNQFLTIIVLLYTNLCNGAFLVFKCPPDSNSVMRWAVNGEVICYKGEHMHLAIASIFTLYLLSMVPILLITISWGDMHGKHHIVSIYEKKYFRKYKHWEAVKLLLRFAIAMILILPSGLDTFIYPCVVVSIMCLLLMVATSLIQPSLNSYANHFESLCLLVLAFTGIRETTHFNEEFSGILLILPYCIFLLVKGSNFIDICMKKVKGKWKGCSIYV